MTYEWYLKQSMKYRHMILIQLPVGLWSLINLKYGSNGPDDLTSLSQKVGLLFSSAWLLLPTLEIHLSREGWLEKIYLGVDSGLHNFIPHERNRRGHGEQLLFGIKRRIDLVKNIIFEWTYRFSWKFQMSPAIWGNEENINRRTDISE